ncbi:MAG TPA: hypothetical protein VF618_25115 [Thermoanaerobaculia bacterium]
MDARHIESLYHEIATQPREEQLSRVHQLPLDVRASLWIFHLRRFLELHPELSTEQRSIVEQSVNLLGTPGFFRDEEELQRDANLDARWSALQKRARAVFPSELIYVIFYKFGDEIPQFGSP